MKLSKTPKRSKTTEVFVVVQKSPPQPPGTQVFAVYPEKSPQAPVHVFVSSAKPETTAPARPSEAAETLDAAALLSAFSPAIVLEKLDAALKRRRSQTPFISDAERDKLRDVCAQIFSHPAEATVARHLKRIYASHVYLAAEGNIILFCTEILGFHETQARKLLGLSDTEGSVVPAGGDVPGGAEAPAITSQGGMNSAAAPANTTSSPTGSAIETLKAPKSSQSSPGCQEKPAVGHLGVNSITYPNGSIEILRPNGTQEARALNKPLQPIATLRLATGPVHPPEKPPLTKPSEAAKGAVKEHAAVVGTPTSTDGSAGQSERKPTASQSEVSHSGNAASAAVRASAQHTSSTKPSNSDRSGTAQPRQAKPKMKKSSTYKAARAGVSKPVSPHMRGTQLAVGGPPGKKPKHRPAVAVKHAPRSQTVAGQVKQKADETTSVAKQPHRAQRAIGGTTQVSAVLQPIGDSDPEFWASRINEHLTAGVASFVEAGVDLVAAKAKLDHGQFLSLFQPGMLRVDLRTAEKLMRIARSKALSKSTNWSNLPSALNSLHELARLGEVRLQKAIDNGKITPAMTISETRVLVSSLQPSGEKTGHAAADKLEGPPAPLYDRAKHDAAFQRIAGMLDKELGRCPDLEWKARLLKRLAAHLASLPGAGTATKGGRK